MADQSAAIVLTSSTPAPAAPAAPAPAAPVGNAAALAAVPAASDPAAAPPASQTPAANAAWYGETIDPNVKTWVDGKQYKDAATALAAHMNAEKMLGVPADQLIRKPKGADDVEGKKAYLTSIGVPEAADKYELPVPEGFNPDFAKNASAWMLEAGIPKEAGQALTAKWNEFIKTEVARNIEAEKTEFASGMVQLKDNWGGAYDERVELAKRALRTFGKEIGINEIGDAGFQALEKGAGGGVQLIKLLAAVGARTSEDAFVGGGTPTFTMTAEQANAKIAELKNDKVWTQAYLNGDKNKQAEFQKLMAISVGTAK